METALGLDILHEKHHPNDVLLLDGTDDCDVDNGLLLPKDLRGKNGREMLRHTRFFWLVQQMCLLRYSSHI